MIGILLKQVLKPHVKAMLKLDIYRTNVI